jgi:hypothetical protein
MRRKSKPSDTASNAFLASWDDQPEPLFAQQSVYRGSHSMRRKPKPSVAETASSALFGASATIFKIAVVVFIAIVLYWAFILFNGQLKEATAAGVGVVGATGHLLFLSGVLAAATLAILSSDDITVTVVMAIVGVVLFLGVPALVMGQVGGKLNEAATTLVDWGRLTAQGILVVVGLRVIYEIYRSQAEAEIRKASKAREAREQAPAGRRSALKPPKESAMAKCWEMPFCHEAVRELCPAFKAKKPCWKHGRGCNCDPDLIDTLVMNRNSGPSRGARGIEAEYIRQDLQADLVKSRSDRTIPCSKCPIYTEHQRRKFKIVNPVLIALVVATLYLFYDPLTQFYGVIAVHVADLASGSALNPGQAAETVQYWRDYLNSPALAGAFVAIIGLFALAWILKFGEWLILERKLV